MESSGPAISGPRRPGAQALPQSRSNFGRRATARLGMDWEWGISIRQDQAAGADSPRISRGSQPTAWRHLMPRRIAIERFERGRIS